MPNTPNVAIIAYDGAQQSALFGLGEMFDMANRMTDPALGQQITHRLVSSSDIAENPQFDAIILPPNLTGKRGTSDHALHAWLKQQHLAGSTLCSACAGGYWLGHAGLLDGRRATTHWALEADFREAFPKVLLGPEHILLDDNDIVTAGGVMAWVDLGVHLIGRWLGPTVVSRTCRQMLIDPTGREQRNYRAFRPETSHTDQTIRALQHWMETHANDDLSLPMLAAHSGLSTRSLQRRFTKSTGLPVNRYIQELRVEKAKGLLELTSLPISQICWQVGYQDVSAFNRLFKSVTGLSAGSYRQRFKISKTN
ncbi:GlxA family transcriptional regulator [Lentibacter algarum]|uniref:GlxA family transcriptional regulator n=1 Tax=Lentibacter algarum TaxID=576131 RepID=UPI0020907079|nr:helix-turn-helix domain-containing protein [Lentibacter algarum]